MVLMCRIKKLLDENERYAHEKHGIFDSHWQEGTKHPAPSHVVFPPRGGVTDDDPDTPPTPDALPSHSHRGDRSGKRTLSELLKLHAERALT